MRRSPSGAGSATSRSSAHRNAASVFPDPVGAETSTFSPAAMAGQALSCACRGALERAREPVTYPWVERCERVRRHATPERTAWIVWAACSVSANSPSCSPPRLFPPVAACGQSDVDKAKNSVQDAADEVKGDLNDVSKKDLENALNDAQDAAKNGSADTKRKARELQRKIERELNSRK